MHYSAILLASTAADIAVSRISDSWAWYIIRASGLLSLATLVLLMISGIGHVTGWTFRFLAPIQAWAVHKAIAIILGVSIAVHMLSLLFDHYIGFKIADVLVPFVKTYSNNTSLLGLSLGWLAIPAGIVAAYGTYIVLFSSTDTTGWIYRHKKLWKVSHVISYAVIFLAILHALSAGTDFKENSWRWLLISCGILLVIGIVARLTRLQRSPTS